MCVCVGGGGGEQCQIDRAAVVGGIPPTWGPQEMASPLFVKTPNPNRPDSPRESDIYGFWDLGVLTLS